MLLKKGTKDEVQNMFVYLTAKGEGDNKWFISLSGDNDNDDDVNN